MKNVAMLVSVVAILALVWMRVGVPNLVVDAPPSNDTQTLADSSTKLDIFRTAFEQKQSGIQVKGEGIVSKLLADDNDGSRHQRFILTLPSGQTLLVAHNIDIAPRINALKTGDTVSFNGVYEWNDKGGVIHWTHRDPNGRNKNGWLKHAGKKYQ